MHSCGSRCISVGTAKRSPVALSLRAAGGWQARPRERDVLERRLLYLQPRDALRCHLRLHVRLLRNVNVPDRRWGPQGRHQICAGEHETALHGEVQIRLLVFGQTKNIISEARRLAATTVLLHMVKAFLLFL